MRMLDDYMAMGYSIDMTKRPDGSWFVTVKGLPGCTAEGGTFKEAMDNIEDAMGPAIEAANDVAVEALTRRLREAREAKATADEADRT